MTQQELFDIQQLGRKLTAFGKAMESLRAVVESREMIAKNLHAKYPNMTIRAIRDRIWEQEEDFVKKAKVEHEEARVAACSLGVDIKPIDIRCQLAGLIRKTYPCLEDVNF